MAVYKSTLPTGTIGTETGTTLEDPALASGKIQTVTPPRPGAASQAMPPPPMSEGSMGITSGGRVAANKYRKLNEDMMLTEFS